MNQAIKRAIVFCIACIICVFGQKINPALTTPKVSNLPNVNTTQEINFARHFQQLGIDGSILIYDAQSDRTYQHNIGTIKLVVDFN